LWAACGRANSTSPTEHVGTRRNAGAHCVRAAPYRSWGSYRAHDRLVRTALPAISRPFPKKYGHEPFDASRPLTGGLATHCLLFPGTGVEVVPDTVPDEVAAPASCATATVAAVLAAAGSLQPGMRALVTGVGMLGITATAMLT